MTVFVFVGSTGSWNALLLYASMTHEFKEISLMSILFQKDRFIFEFLLQVFRNERKLCE
jgi:hypothetical protein